MRVHWLQVSAVDGPMLSCCPSSSAESSELFTTAALRVWSSSKTEKSLTDRIQTDHWSDQSYLCNCKDRTGTGTGTYLLSAGSWVIASAIGFSRWSQGAVEFCTAGVQALVNSLMSPRSVAWNKFRSEEVINSNEDRNKIFHNWLLL